MKVQGGLLWFVAAYERRDNYFLHAETGKDMTLQYLNSLCANSSTVVVLHLYKFRPPGDPGRAGTSIL